jgi:hypothetical protein
MPDETLAAAPSSKGKLTMAHDPSRPSRRHHGSLTALRPLLLAAIAGTSVLACARDVEKLRQEQDERIKKDGLPVVLAQHKRDYESHTNDPVATYLYARIAPEPQEQMDLARVLISKHPTFAWGHFFAGSQFESRGEYDNAILELDKAATLATNSRIIQKRAADIRYGHVTVTAELGNTVQERWDALLKKPYRNVMAVDPPLYTKMRIVATLTKVELDDEDIYWHMLDLTTNWDWVRKAFATEPAKGRSFEVLATTGWLAGGFFLAKLYIRNTGSRDIVLSSNDVNAGKAATCFKKSGQEVPPTKNEYQKINKQACRTCSGDDIRIPAGSMARAYGVFPAERSQLANCAFFKIPDELGFVDVRIP